MFPENKTNLPHRRLNILTGEWVLVSPQRAKRPWQGKQEKVHSAKRPAYDEGCYLCPGNARAEGVKNPEYKQSFVFENDFAALLSSSETVHSTDLLKAESATGICKVIAFSPRHDLTLAELPLQDVEAVIHTWCHEFETIAAQKHIRYIQIFENKGDIMGCSNPHPHGQIWASDFIPNEIEKEEHHQKIYFEKEGTTLLYDYIIQEMILNDRVVCENEDFVALVPFWAVWPYEVMIISKRPVNNILGFTNHEKRSLAKILKNMTSIYDLLFDTSFPYSAGMHQVPVNDGAKPWWHWHMHFYPPLLRSATVKKFMVGYEMLCGPQRDITPEQAAEQLRNVKVGRNAGVKEEGASLR